MRSALAPEEHSANGELEAVRERSAAAIERGAGEVEDWPLTEDGFELLRSGLKRAYSRGRQRFREARAKPDDEALHEWRKRSKDLWYHLRLVRNGWKPVLGAAADEAHALSDLLGDDHDLVVLSAHLEQAHERLTRDQLDHVGRLIGKRREELQRRASAHGERLFAEKPKRFVNRIERYWEAARL